MWQTGRAGQRPGSACTQVMVGVLVAMSAVDCGGIVGTVGLVTVTTASVGVPVAASRTELAQVRVEGEAAPGDGRVPPWAACPGCPGGVCASGWCALPRWTDDGAPRGLPSQRAAWRRACYSREAC